ncbi:MAG: hypothetical protein IJ548_03285 [Paludibacteraceae bacterium]|nr:hypothetical protein [Paludibacteraceae bacterium]MBQ9672602.1 hypothetical protein [Prevotella sp.]
MNKIYVCPQLTISAVELSHLLMGSGVSDPEKGIDYGGVDEEGQKDPASRRRRKWDEEEDEEWNDFQC